jgi:hypothetical protein
MAIFRKYEFIDIETFVELKDALEFDPQTLFVELGILRDDKYSVDVLWSMHAPQEWIDYEIWDVDGNGSHTFLGTQFNIS